MRDQESRYSPNAHGHPVLEKCLHIPRNDPMEQSDYIIFSSHQCTGMVPDGKGQNPVFNSVLTLTLTNCLKFLIKVLSPKCSFSFLTKNKGGSVRKMSVCRFEVPKPALAGQLLPGHLGVLQKVDQSPLSPTASGQPVTLELIPLKSLCIAVLRSIKLPGHVGKAKYSFKIQLITSSMKPYLTASHFEAESSPPCHKHLHIIALMSLYTCLPQSYRPHQPGDPTYIGFLYPHRPLEFTITCHLLPSQSWR